MNSHHNTPRLKTLAGVIASLAASGALAQEPEVRQASDLVVTGTRVEQSSFDLPMSIDAVDKSTIQDQQATVNLSETLVRVPGIQVQNRQNYAQDLQVSSRGFGTRSTFGIRGIRLITDDIPATMPDGQGQGATFNLESARQIEVLRGPFSAIYGNASGGVIQSFTEDGPERPTVGGSLLFGSDDTRKYGLKVGGQAGIFNYIATLSRFETDGYRDHSETERDQFNSKLGFKLSDTASLRVTLNALKQPDTEDPLGLTRAQFEANPKGVDQSALDFNTRKSIENNQIGLVYDQKIGANNSLKLIGYTGTRDVEQILSIPPGPQNAATHSGGVVSLDREFGGMGLRWTYRANPLTLTAGIDYDRMKERRQGFLNFTGPSGAPTARGVKGNLKRDEDNTVTSFDQYVQAEFDATAALRLFGGLRNSAIKFKSQDYFIPGGTNGDDSGSKKYTNVSPVFGVLYKITPATNVYANYGKGFETPTFAELAYKATGGSGLNFDLKAMKSNNFEIGAKTLLGETTRLNAAAFLIKTRDEIVPNTNSGGRSTFQNATKSERKGLELGLETEFGAGFSGYLALSYLNAEFKESFQVSNTVAGVTTVRTVNAGNELPGVPKTSLYGELAYKLPKIGFSTALEMRHSDRVFVDDRNTDAAPSYTVFNVRAGFQQQLGKWQLKEFLRIDNISDEKYAGSVIVNEGNSRFFEPAPERSYLIGFNASYQF